MPVNAQTITNQLWPTPGTQKVYLLVDAARDDQVSDLLYQLKPEEYTCLFEGHWAEDLAFVAPYLVALQTQAAWTKTYIEQAWGKDWGVYLETDIALPQLLGHLRKLLFMPVQSTPPKSLYFRYYDPRVLQIYLSHGDDAEKKLLFGPIKNYWIEDEASGTLTKYASSDVAGATPAATAVTTEKHKSDFEQTIRQEFEERLVEYLQEEFPETGQSLDALPQFVTQQIEKALSYKLETQLQVATYVTAAWLAGPDFDTTIEGAKEILTSTEYTADQKTESLDTIIDLLAPQEEEE